MFGTGSLSRWPQVAATKLAARTPHHHPQSSCRLELGRLRTLRTLYASYARPAALYASGVWFPFLARTHASRLESANYAAARVITGAPVGSNAKATCQEAGVLSLAQQLLTKRDAASLLLHVKRFPSHHVLRHLTSTASPLPRRLRTAGGRRGCWFDTASTALSCCFPSDISPEAWPKRCEVPASWDHQLDHPISFVLAEKL